MNKPVVRIISGIDPTGHAGSICDIRTLSYLGVDVTTASDSHINALKIGVIESPQTYHTTIDYCRDFSGPIVFDPVIYSSGGTPLFSSSLEEHLTNIKALIPQVDLVTPNLVEAEILLDRSIQTYQDRIAAAQALIALGAKTVLLKGGHAQDGLFSHDYWTNGEESFWLISPRYPIKNYRGTGCMLSSAITGCLASGYSLKDAMVIAKMIVSRGIRLSQSLDNTTAILFYGPWPEEQVDLPYLSPTPLIHPPKIFAPSPIGLYPVVNRYKWLEILLPLGVKFIQLRIKDLSGVELENEIQKSIQLAKHYGARLFINDDWELAVRFGAEGLHLGQGDIEMADIDRIHAAGIALGISTHCHYEVARAHTLRPSYMAYGPIYPTTSKIMSFKPQGIKQLQCWRRTLDYPLVAIGGINHERLLDILDSEVEGIAVISAITQALDPIASTQTFLNMINEHQHVESF